MQNVDAIRQTINRERSIIINEPIDDELVRKLTPLILSLRQKSNDPITIGIDSPGGSLGSLDTLLGLLTGPTQNEKSGSIVTVVTNRAYSAAASFLAFGSYAVALKHSKILYHDVRYGGISDVTPEKARDAAKELQDANDVFSLKLANRIIKRLVWIYVDLSTEFEDTNKKFPKTYKKYSEVIHSFAPPIEGQHSVDLASFATCIFAKLSSQNDVLIRNVMQSLSQWILLTQLLQKIPTYRPKRSRTGGLLDGARQLHKLFNNGKGEESFASAEQDLKLLLSLIVSNIPSATNSNGKAKFSVLLEQATRDFVLMQSMNDKKHQQSANKLMLQHEITFFGRKISIELEGKNEEEQMLILSTAVPYARLFWYFCVLLCRELFEGEHILTPRDAQLLGLVDEVAGGGPVESPRDYVLRDLKNVKSEDKESN